VRQRLAGVGPDRRFAVRSSAECEDSASASFAGQFQSVLDVPASEVPAAVVEVHRSLEHPSVLAYARRMGHPVPDALAVLIQEQIHPRTAGVCFTADPVTGAPDVVVEWADGLGDALISGRALPAGTARLPRAVLDAEPQLTGLPDDVAAAVRIAVRLARRAGRPQDVEWAADARGLWVVQARPITTLPIGERR
jgi:phosphoenolpyruvate synthase/pyruvate phosphate dikinase